jgi:hypothetical protein
MDHVRLNATRLEPARQPKAVAAGFEGQRNPRDCAAGLDRLIPPAMQHGKQPFWARLQLLVRLPLNTRNDYRRSDRQAHGQRCAVSRLMHRGKTDCYSISSSVATSNGRNRGATADVRRHAVADCPAAGTTCANMREQRDQICQATAAKVCLDLAKSGHFTVPVLSTAGFNRPLFALSTICRCPSR